MTPLLRQRLARVFVSILFCGAGIGHFTHEALFVSIVPPYLMYPETLVIVSGVFEILGGIGVWAPWQKLRRAAGYGLVALLVAVYIVNIDMALHGSPLRDGRAVPGGSLVLWLRLPLQFVMMWLVMYATRELPPVPTASVAVDPGASAGSAPDPS